MISVVLLSGGMGLRMEATVPKQYLELRGKPISLYSLEVFCAHPQIDEIIIVCEEDYKELFTSYKESIPTFADRLSFAKPGVRRQDSVFNGLQETHPTSEWIIIHDAARPFITGDMVDNVFQAAQTCGAATLGMPVKFTVKHVNEKQMVNHTFDRSKVWEIQTPQVMQRKILVEGLEKARKEELTVTDDTALAELVGVPVKVVEGAYSNIKITTPEDRILAENLYEFV